MSVHRLLAEVSSRELSEWMAFERLEGPLGGGRGDVQTAVVAATVANVNRPRNTSPRPIGDFIPTWDGDRAAGGERSGGGGEQTPEEQKTVARRWVAAMGGTVRGE